MRAQIECIRISSFHRFVKLYVPHVCLLLYSLSTSLVVFLDFSVQLWNSASLLLAAVHCLSLTHARTMLVFAVLFCQSMSFPGVEYSVLSTLIFRLVAPCHSQQSP